MHFNMTVILKKFKKFGKNEYFNNFNNYFYEQYTRKNFKRFEWHLG